MEVMCTIVGSCRGTRNWSTIGGDL